MATGVSLSETMPSNTDYEQVEDEELKRILRFIFDDKSSVKKVRLLHAC